MNQVMKQTLKLVGAAFLAFALSACADDTQEKVDEYNALLNELSVLPNPSWSDEELDAYEQKLNRLISLDSQLRMMNGKNGATVWVPDNSEFFATCRAALDNARSVKRSKDSLERIIKLQEEFKSLNNGIQEALQKFDNDPNDVAQAEVVISYLRKLIINRQEVIRLIQIYKGEIKDVDTAIKELQDVVNGYTDAMNKLIEYRMQKMEAADQEAS